MNMTLQPILPALSDAAPLSSDLEANFLVDLKTN